MVVGRRVREPRPGLEEGELLDGHGSETHACGAAGIIRAALVVGSCSAVYGAGRWFGSARDRPRRVREDPPARPMTPDLRDLVSCSPQEEGPRL